MIAVVDNEHLNAMLFVEPTATVQPVSDNLPDMALEFARLLTPHSDTVAPPGVCLTKDA